MIAAIVSQVNYLLYGRGRRSLGLFTPPYHSDLQPIELIWAITKGDVGRQYDININFKDVLYRLNNAFNDLSSDVIQGCIRKTDSLIKILYE
ncbi:hypothetical protein A3Q56_06837 [Intoshia linei]|uniref:Tc1-like transposase DDE domain-containing protein n=1 Tax=Intoshia linei TaxID=1819745 RepID=A0A177ATV9_9BILA|nr:hypothetical protein A3Q56_06837 [Intoshia linei]